MAKIRLLPSEARRRGLAAVGFDLIYGGDGVTSEPVTAPVVARIVELRDGQRIGSMTFEIVPARMVIDRDGVLEKLVLDRLPDASPRPVTLDTGATGYRAEHVLVLAPDDYGAGGAVIVTIDAAPDWPTGATILSTLRVFCRDSDARAASAPVAS